MVTGGRRLLIGVTVTLCLALVGCARNSSFARLPDEVTQVGPPISDAAIQHATTAFTWLGSHGTIAGFRGAADSYQPASAVIDSLERSSDGLHLTAAVYGSPLPAGVDCGYDYKLTALVSPTLIVLYVTEDPGKWPGGSRVACPAIGALRTTSAVVLPRASAANIPVVDLATGAQL